MRLFELMILALLLLPASIAVAAGVQDDDRPKQSVADDAVIEAQEASAQPVIHQIVDPQSIEFHSGATHYVHRAATRRLPQLTIRGLANAKIHFLGPIRGNVETKSSWQDDRGVVNLVDCENVEITGLHVTNRRKYEPIAILGKQESTALCVSRSRGVKIADSSFTGAGKSVVLVHSGSDVSLTRTKIKGYYFELHVGASSVKLDEVRFEQHNPQVGDSHAAIWVSSSMRDDRKKLFKQTSVSLRKASFNLKSGRAIVSGNGSYETKSTLTFEDVPVIRHTYPAVGFTIYHGNYHSIHVELKRPVPGLVDLVQARGGRGIGRYMIYHQPPGHPSSKSPIVVDGVSSDTIRSDYFRSGRP